VESQDNHRCVSHHGGVSDEEPRPEEQTAPLSAQQPPVPAEQTARLSADQPPATEGHPQRWRDRAWSLRAVIAVGLVAVVLGGLAGAAIASVGDHQDQRGGPGFGRFQGGPGMPPGQGRMGQRPQWRFNDPYGSGQRQWDQQQRPGGPNGPLQRFGRGDNPGNNPTPPPTPSPTR
jgi:hypothetical protein